MKDIIFVHNAYCEILTRVNLDPKTAINCFHNFNQTHLSALTLHF